VFGPAAIASRPAIFPGSAFTQRPPQVHLSTIALPAIFAGAPFLARACHGLCHLALKPPDPTCRIQDFKESLMNRLGSWAAGARSAELPQVISSSEDGGSLPGLKAQACSDLEAPGRMFVSYLSARQRPRRR